MRMLLLLALPVCAADVTPAVDHFRKAEYREAAALFAQCEGLTPDQTTAWAYCRLRLAAESWNASKGDNARPVVAEATAALQLVPDHGELQKFGGELIRAAGGTPPTFEKANEKAKAATPGWFALESDNFRVRYPSAAKELAASISAKAEEGRAGIFNRWSGPPGCAWSVKCEIVIHASAADFAHATSLSEAATGHALVQMADGKPSLRRIDLRLDDDTAAIDALPRELTHVVLADLFPSTPPPRWAADGMATLAMSSTMVDRYLKTAARVGVPAAEMLLADKVDDVTARAVGSAALVDLLVRLKGERSLTICLRDIRRYGLEKSLDRQYGFSSLKALDQALAK